MLAVCATAALLGAGCSRSPSGAPTSAPAPAATADGNGGNAVAQTSAPAGPFHATEVSGLDYGRGVPLADTLGEPRSVESFKGSVAVWFFGFANCPDICPTTLARLQQVRAAVGADAKAIQVVFVTLDPERDTADKLAPYVAQFDPSFVALRPEPRQMPAVQASFRVIASKMPMPDTDAYMIDHSSVIYVYDRSGALRLIAQPDFQVPQLAADLTRLVRE
jgi:protein SCO1